MIALLSALLGFGSSMVPDLLKLIQDKRDKAHEIELIKLQAQAADKQADNDLTKTIAIAEGQQAVAIQESYRTDVRSTIEAGFGWVAALSASVRPILTYLFFFLYVAVKYSQIHLMMNPTMPWQTAITFAEAISTAWGEEDMAIFSAIVAFWFGSRSVRK